MAKKPFNTKGFEVEYAAWKNMKYRCGNPHHRRWKDYGGRGITVCERWKLFENFKSDMGHKPSPDLTLERINNELGYFKENCAWETRTHQSRNRRPYPKGTHRMHRIYKPYNRGPMSKTVSRWGLPLTIKEMCRIVGVPYTTYKYRLKHSGMTPVQSLFTPVRPYMKHG